MDAAIIEEQRFGGALALVVTGARTDRIDVSYIIFGLWMGLRIAIDLARRRLQHAGRFTAREIEDVECAHDACLQGTNGIALVMPRRSRASEIVDLVHRLRDIKRVANVMLEEAKSRMVLVYCPNFRCRDYRRR
jgi:hypothetical protein